MLHECRVVCVSDDKQNVLLTMRAAILIFTALLCYLVSSSGGIIVLQHVHQFFFLPFYLALILL